MEKKAKGKEKAGAFLFLLESAVGIPSLLLRKMKSYDGTGVSIPII